MLSVVNTCREGIASVYDEMLVSEEISSDAALQLLADLIFLTLALSGDRKGEFDHVKEKLVEKVLLIFLEILISV